MCQKPHWVASQKLRKLSGLFGPTHVGRRVLGKSFGKNGDETRKSRHVYFRRVQCKPSLYVLQTFFPRMCQPDPFGVPFGGLRSSLRDNAICSNDRPLRYRVTKRLLAAWYFAVWTREILSPNTTSRKVKSMVFDDGI